MEAENGTHEIDIHATTADDSKQQQQPTAEPPRKKLTERARPGAPAATQLPQSANAARTQSVPAAGSSQSVQEQDETKQPHAPHHALHHPPALTIPTPRKSQQSQHAANTPSNTLITAAASATSPTTARQHVKRQLAEEEATLEEFLHVASMQGYQYSYFRALLFFVFSLATAGILALLAHWFPLSFMSWRYSACEMHEAEYVYVNGVQHGGQLVKVLPTAAETEEEAKQRRVNEQYQQTNNPEAARGLPPSASFASTASSDADNHSQLQYSRAAQQRRPEQQQPLLSSPSTVGSRMQSRDARMIVWRHNRFMYDPATRSFERVTYMSSAPAATLDQRLKTGLQESVAEERLGWYGHNILTIIVPSYVSLLLGEVFHPFYIFQIYSVILWCFEYYYIFASAIAIIAVVSIVTTLLETRRRLISLSTLAYYSSYVHTLRGGVWQLTTSVDLVVGDVVEVTTGTVPCDVCLLDGGCVVNESMLTGESIPVVKGNVQWPVERTSSQPISLGTEPRSTLYSATKVLQLKPSSGGSKVLGIVVRTGFATTKGSLILSILYPKPSTFKFEQQSYKFIASLFSVALIGFGLTIWQLKRRDAADTTIFIRACDLVTIVVPPTLPLALSVGTNFALATLKAMKVFCISPSRINMAGKVRLMGFDKTGTLTAEGLEFIGVMASVEGRFTQYETEVNVDEAAVLAATPSSTRHQHTPRQSPTVKAQLAAEKKEVEWVEDEETEDAGTAPLSPTAPSQFAYDPDRPYTISRPVLLAMSTCHSLAVLDGTLIGDPLDVQVFETTRATLQDQGDLMGYLSLVHIGGAKGEKVHVLGVREQFDFVAALQRMSVVVEDVDSKQGTCYVKGSPEAISALCEQSSIPDSFASVLSQYTHQGYRVIAFASKRLDEPLPHVDKAQQRLLVERDLTFMGLLLLENAVKPETPGTLAILTKARVRCVMVTGDNPLTAVAVAKECGLIAKGTVVYQSALEKTMRGEELVWRDTDNAASLLDPLTLRPTSAVKPQRWELAVTGPAFAYLQGMANSSADGSPFHRALLGGQIFARMLPDQKASLIGELQAMGIYAGFCGDGANDVASRAHRHALLTLTSLSACSPLTKRLSAHFRFLFFALVQCGALKAAMVGVSLSESEASIAAPFTYQRPNIECIPPLLSEGRSSLVTSFQLFRYISMYSLTQFGAAILTYFVGSVLGNWQYLYQDLIIVFPITIFMGATNANRALSTKRPSAQLTSVTNICSLIGHALIILAFQIFIFLYTQRQPLYTALPNPDNTPYAYETTALYYYSNFQYLIVAALFSLGRPFKASPLSNKKLTGWWLLMLAVSLLFLLVNDRWGFWRGDDVALWEGWRHEMLLIVAVNAFASAMWELYWWPALAECGKSLARTRGGRGREGSWYGRRKTVRGEGVKEYYRLRGEFEQNWYDGQGDVRVLGGAKRK